jgi:hypothetical protein
MVSSSLMQKLYSLAKSFTIATYHTSQDHSRHLVKFTGTIKNCHMSRDSRDYWYWMIMMVILNTGRYLGDLCMSTRQSWDEAVASAHLRSSSYHTIAPW